VLTSITTYFLTIFKPSKLFFKRVDKTGHIFLWCEDEEATGAHCAVNWSQVCLPKALGGLGIKKLEFFSRALRLRWKWFLWADEARPWSGLPLPCEEVDDDLFAASITITLGGWPDFGLMSG
jgi:hypothetical protein